MPMTPRSAPAHGEKSVNDLDWPTRCAITQRSQVRQQTNKPEKCGNRSVSGDCKNVPNERAAELRPDAHRAGIWEHVKRHPRTAGMDERENTGASNGKQRHRFRKTVDGGAPLLVQQEQNGGNQRTGVADTDPPDEVY